LPLAPFHLHCACARVHAQVGAADGPRVARRACALEAARAARKVVGAEFAGGVEVASDVLARLHLHRVLVRRRRLVRERLRRRPLHQHRRRRRACRRHRHYMCTNTPGLVSFRSKRLEELCEWPKITQRVATPPFLVRKLHTELNYCQKAHRDSIYKTNRETESEFNHYLERERFSDTARQKYLMVCVTIDKIHCFCDYIAA